MATIKSIHVALNDPRYPGKRAYTCSDISKFVCAAIDTMKCVDISKIGTDEAYTHALMCNGEFFCPICEMSDISTYLHKHYKDIMVDIASNVAELIWSIRRSYTPEVNELSVKELTMTTIPLTQQMVENLKTLCCIKDQYPTVNSIPQDKLDQIELYMSGVVDSAHANSTHHEELLKGYLQQPLDNSYKQHTSWPIWRLLEIVDYYLELRTYDMNDEDDVQSLLQYVERKSLILRLHALSLLSTLTVKESFLIHDRYDINDTKTQRLNHIAAERWMDGLPSYKPNCVMLYKDLMLPNKKADIAYIDKPVRTDCPSVRYLYMFHELCYYVY